MKQYQCLNCPEQPIFLDLDHLKEHWNATHTSPMVIRETDPWGQREPRVKQLYKEISTDG